MPEQDNHQAAAAPAIDFNAAGRLVSSLLRDEDRDRAGDARLTWVEIPGYLLLGVSGAGSTGVVFEVVREGSDARLAMKVFRPLNPSHARSVDAIPGFGRQRPEPCLRAWREFEILCRTRLPAVPRLIDYGHHAGYFYVVTEFIDGKPLDEHFAAANIAGDRRVATREGVRSVIEGIAKVAEALQSLHDAGIIHRDIKPSNVLMNSRGDPVLIDLGIAVLCGDDAGQTIGPGDTPIGSPAFMAPEQARGERAAISERSDIYSLGATAYLLLTGATPHAAEGPLIETLRRVANDEPRSPRELNPALPRDPNTVLLKAVAHRPSDRYQSAAEFAADLRRWLAGAAVEATDPSWARRTARMMRRHPILATSVACTSLLLVTALLIMHARRWRHTLVGVLVSPDGRFVDFVSSTGERIHRCDSGAERGVRSAAILPSDGSKDGARILVTFRAEAKIPEAGQLCVYSASQPYQILWRSGAKPAGLEMPPPHANGANDFYRVAVAFPAELFADSPGSEIVALHQHYPDCPTAIRVYSLSGEVLFEAWHWGRLNTADWVSDARLLVLGGVNNSVMVSSLAEKAPERDEPTLAVFALRPERGQLGGWVFNGGIESGFDAQWYSSLTPPGAYAAIDIGSALVDQPVQPEQRGSHVRFQLASQRVVNSVRPTVSWLIGIDGSIDGSLIDDDFCEVAGWPKDRPLRLVPLTSLLDSRSRHPSGPHPGDVNIR
jgi:serine/threonine protein kinase